MRCVCVCLWKTVRKIISVLINFQKGTKKADTKRVLNTDKDLLITVNRKLISYQFCKLFPPIFMSFQIIHKKDRESERERKREGEKCKYS